MQHSRQETVWLNWEGKSNDGKKSAGHEYFLKELPGFADGLDLGS